MNLAGEAGRSASFTYWYRKVMPIVDRLGLAQVRHRLLSEVSGRVLEIGAGTGLNFPHYTREIDLTIAEPNPYMVDILRNVSAVRKIEIIGKRIEDIAADDARDSSFDYVVSTLVLCSVNDIGEALTAISRLLKPGGEFLFIEHEVAPGFYGPFQKIVTPFWSKVADGCQLNREIVIAIDESPLVVTKLMRFRFPLGSPLVPYGIVGAARLKSDFFG